MADQLLECVPNISEGQRPEVIEAVASAIRTVPGVYLLEVDPGFSANRTVFTFIGPPEATIEAAFRCMSKAAELIDMRRHTGIHPRMGATDVCPLVPVRGMSLLEADQYARRLAERVGRELNIPVYLYEASATASHRQNLAHIRSGEYEGFQQKILDPRWQPDFGPKRFQPQAGQTVIGAREFLLAYNLNLNSSSVSIANEIARDLRESGRQVLKDGQKVRQAGLFKGLKAIGWYVEEYGFAQVSTNITRMGISPVAQVYTAARGLAKRYGVEVTGSELIGLVPQAALLAAGQELSLAPGLDDHALMQAAVEGLGLAQLKPFNLGEKVLELRYEELRSREA